MENRQQLPSDSKTSFVSHILLFSPELFCLFCVTSLSFTWYYILDKILFNGPFLRPKVNIVTDFSDQPSANLLLLYNKFFPTDLFSGCNRPRTPPLTASIPCENKITSYCTHARGGRILKHYESRTVLHLLTLHQ